MKKTVLVLSLVGCLLSFSALSLFSEGVAESANPAEAGECPMQVVVDSKGEHHLPIQFKEHYPLLADMQAREKRLAWFKKTTLGLYVDFGLHTFIGSEFEGRTVSDSEWMLHLGRIEPAVYEKTAKSYNVKGIRTAEFIQFVKWFDPEYVVLNAKHLDGFSMWDSKYTDYDVVDAPGPLGKDLYAEIVPQLKKMGIKVGYHYSILDWYHASQANLDSNGNKKIVDINTTVTETSKQEYIDYMKHQLTELMNRYGADFFLFDGEWVPWWSSKDGWDLQEYLLSVNPNIIVNDKIGGRTRFDGDFTTYDQLHPYALKKFQRPWQLLFQTDFRFGYKAQSWVVYYKELVKQYINAANRGGSFLFKVSGGQHAEIDDKVNASVGQVKSWLGQTRPYLENLQPLPMQYFQTGSDVIFRDWRRFVMKDNKLYLIGLYFPGGAYINVPEMKDKIFTKAYFINNQQPLPILNQDQVLKKRAQDLLKAKASPDSKKACKKSLEGEGTAFSCQLDKECYGYCPVDFHKTDYRYVHFSMKHWPKTKGIVIVCFEFEDLPEEVLLEKYGH